MTPSSRVVCDLLRARSIALAERDSVTGMLRSACLRNYLTDLTFLENRVCVLLCFINLILGNRYGPGVSSCQLEQT